MWIPFNAVVLETFPDAGKLERSKPVYPFAIAYVCNLFMGKSGKSIALVVYLAAVTAINHSLANYIHSLVTAMCPKAGTVISHKALHKPGLDFCRF